MSLPDQSWHDRGAPLCKDCGHVAEAHRPGLCVLIFCDCLGMKK